MFHSIWCLLDSEKERSRALYDIVMRRELRATFCACWSVAIDEDTGCTHNEDIRLLAMHFGITSAPLGDFLCTKRLYVLIVTIAAAAAIATSFSICLLACVENAKRNHYRERENLLRRPIYTELHYTGWWWWSFFKPPSQPPPRLYCRLYSIESILHRDDSD